VTKADTSLIRSRSEQLGLPLADAIVRALRAAAPPGQPSPTILAICPNSEAVVKAAVQAASQAQAPLFFAATLNQVDLDGGYTGWTPGQFVGLVRGLVAEVGYTGPVVVGLDHGGPWLKDVQTREQWPLERAMQGVRDSLAACLDAGYDLLHIDPTVDRTLPPGAPMPIALVVARTLELIAFAEAHRRRAGLPAVSYEVGTEEVHGGLADLSVFRSFLDGLKAGLAQRGLADVWPCFVVGKVGTDLHTTEFDPEVARALARIAAPYGSVIKGHYTDSVSNPEAYPQAGMGGANVGPEFTEAEYQALEALARKEQGLVGRACRLSCDSSCEALAEQEALAKQDRMPAGDVIQALRNAVIASGRWEKWRLPQEQGLAFDQLSPERQAWLVRTGCRYVWTHPRVLAARQRLYANLEAAGEDGEAAVLRAITGVIHRYFRAFRLSGTLPRIESAL
jgi:tagatose-1,6-bisphosphate aldolase non-catalytic subunit AgaZ/GatZ